MQVENSPRLHPRLYRASDKPRAGPDSSGFSERNSRDGRNGAPTIDLTRFTEYGGNIPLNRVRPLGFVLKPIF